MQGATERSSAKHRNEVEPGIARPGHREGNGEGHAQIFIVAVFISHSTHSYINFCDTTKINAPKIEAFDI